LAKVVDQYRTIALYGRDGALEVMGLDPTEDRATGDTLLEHSRPLAVRVGAGGTAVLQRSAFHVGERSFFLYGVPVPGYGAIVVASDVAHFQAPVTAAHPSAARLFVTDPAGVVWAVCGRPSGFRALEAATVPQVVRQAAV